mmetsp:Transcript_122467/g.380645  ORF Transcript_122467/g.380645 Transcript_122467/m.380645 type:complete len:216 (-) Transcript_122467:749-1396(-)
MAAATTPPHGESRPPSRSKLGEVPREVSTCSTALRCRRCAELRRQLRQRAVFEQVRQQALRHRPRRARCGLRARGLGSVASEAGEGVCVSASCRGHLSRAARHGAGSCGILGRRGVAPFARCAVAGGRLRGADSSVRRLLPARLHGWLLRRGRPCRWLQRRLRSRALPFVAPRRQLHDAHVGQVQGPLDLEAELRQERARSQGPRHAHWEHLHLC